MSLSRAPPLSRGLILVDNSDDAGQPDPSEPNDDAGGHHDRRQGNGGEITIEVEGNMTMCGPQGLAPGCGGPGAKTSSLDMDESCTIVADESAGAVISSSKRAGAP